MCHESPVHLRRGAGIQEICTRKSPMILLMNGICPVVFFIPSMQDTVRFIERFLVTSHPVYYCIPRSRADVVSFEVGVEDAYT